SIELKNFPPDLSGEPFCIIKQKDGHKRKNPFLMNGYILNLVTCFDNRGFTKHYDTKVRLLFEYAK
ncbi:hypothetical protein DW783_21945, partial [Phocaeicola vulgatus]